MGSIIGLLVVLCIAVHSSNKTVDSRRIKKWFDKEIKNGD